VEKFWILISDDRHARCFERQPDQSLIELADFVMPLTNLAMRANGGDLTGAAGKGHGRTAHAGQQFEPHTALAAKERDSFARQLADYVNTAVGEQRCTALALIASSQLLGAVKPHLQRATEQLLKRCVASDLTHFSGAELQQRIDHALQLPS